MKTPRALGPDYYTKLVQVLYSIDLQLQVVPDGDTLPQVPLNSTLKCLCVAYAVSFGSLRTRARTESTSDDAATSSDISRSDSLFTATSFKLQKRRKKLLNT